MVGDIYGPMLEDGIQFNTSVNEDFWAALDNPDLFLETTRRVLDDPRALRAGPISSDGNYATYDLGRRHPIEAPVPRNAEPWMIVCDRMPSWMARSGRTRPRRMRSCTEST